MMYQTQVKFKQSAGELLLVFLVTLVYLGTITGSVLAAYISFGISAAHLLSASVMSAPAALAYTKLFYAALPHPPMLSTTLLLLLLF